MYAALSIKDYILFKEYFNKISSYLSQSAFWREVYKKRWENRQEPQNFDIQQKSIANILEQEVIDIAQDFLEIVATFVVQNEGIMSRLKMFYYASNDDGFSFELIVILRIMQIDKS